jgi:Flp pilus assembly protein TadB
VIDGRGLAIVLFAAAAVLVGIGNSTGSKWLQAAAYLLFAFGVLAFLRWRRRRATVLDSEDKTSVEENED